jgi:cytochrome P450
MAIPSNQSSGSKAIATIEPENIKTMLSLKFKDFGLGEEKTAFVPLLGYGIFTTDGGAWQHSREMLRPNFTRSQVGDLETFERHVSRLIQTIPRDGSTIDLSELFFRLTLDSRRIPLRGVYELLGTGHEYGFWPGLRMPSLPARNRQPLSSRVPIRNRPGREVQKDAKFVHDFVDSYVKKALEYRRTHDIEKADMKADERYVFLYELAKQTDNPLQIRSELLNILLAGRDTTASLLSNLWFSGQTTGCMG